MHPIRTFSCPLSLFTAVLIATSVPAAAAEPGPSLAVRAALAARGAHLVKDLGTKESLKRLKCSTDKDTLRDGKDTLSLHFFTRNSEFIGQYDSLSHTDMETAISFLSDNTCGTPGVKSENQNASAITSSVSSPALFGLQAGSAILEGVADFLVNRAKAEVTVFFLNALGDTCSEKNTRIKFLRTYMPSSFQMLSKSEDLTPTLLIPQLKSAVRQDFRNLPSIVSEKIPEEKQEKPYAVLFKAGIRIGTSVREGESPVTATAREINLLAPDLKSEDLRLYQSLKRVAMLAQAYREDNKAIELLLDDATSDGRWYLGYYFLTAQINDALLSDSVWQSGRFREWFITTHDVLTSVRNLQALVDTLRRKDLAGLAPADYAKVLGLTARLTTTGIENLYGESLPAETRRTLQWFRTAMSLHEAVSTKDYYQVLQLSLGVLDSLNIPDDTTAFMPSTRKYLSFAAALATTDSAAQVNQLLESVAAPVGSYRAKRTENSGPSVLTINSYLGLAVGGEGADEKWSPTWTPAAPIGIELTFPRDKWSWGIYLPLIDVGLLASRRLQQDDSDAAVEQDAEIGFAQVLSPGIFVMLGPTSKAPLSLGGGYRYIPQLRDGSEGQLSVHRWEILVAIDLPIFQL